MTVSIHETLAHLHRLERQKEQLANERAVRLRAQVPAVVAVLKERFGATEVWLFGSLCGGQVHIGSDVDLAVRGISASDHMRAWAAVDRFDDAVVDLVRLEEAPESLVERVEEEGERL